MRSSYWCRSCAKSWPSAARSAATPTSIPRRGIWTWPATSGKFKTLDAAGHGSRQALEIDGLLAGTLEIAQKAGVRAPYHRKAVWPDRARRHGFGQLPMILVAPMMDLTDRHCRYFSGQVCSPRRLYIRMITAAR